MENELKILILLFYYNRPKMVRSAIQSIIESDYKNWELAFIDDSDIPESDIDLGLIFPPEDLHKIKIYKTNDTRANKLARGGSVFGGFANQAIQDSNANIVIMLCDDDALIPDYLTNLNNFYKNHININYAHSHVIEFNPLIEDYKNKSKTQSALNFNGPIVPYNNVDASQVSWRIECSKNGGIWFPSPKTNALDYVVYTQLFNKYGNCEFTGFDGQYKAFHDRQLGRTNSYDNVN